LFNPEQPEDIKDKIVDILGNNTIKMNLIEKGKKRVKEFSWEKHAEAIIELFENRRKK
jgi:glycosyltransferase involved in cell wall biosynthesis